MYDELVKKIRHCVTDPMHCLSCDEPKDASCFVRLMTQAVDAIEQLSNAGSAYGRGWTLGYDAGREESKLRWIPVNERLPKEWWPVLGLIQYHDEKEPPAQQVLWYLGNGHWRETWRGDMIESNVTNRMPLPEPPKEETIS